MYTCEFARSYFNKEFHDHSITNSTVNHENDRTYIALTSTNLLHYFNFYRSYASPEFAKGILSLVTCLSCNLQINRLATAQLNKPWDDNHDTSSNYQ